ncbi:MAG: glycosyltransferase [Williamsia sp.]|nr:glycosyltransferase [Williamsia sp.]
MNVVFFTIIVPTFNSEKDIRTCLMSILHQKHPHCEIIVQDGGSTDRTGEIVEEIKQLYPSRSIILNREKDTGIYNAMNRAAEKAAGEWLYFLGSDDSLYNDEVLSTIAGIIRKHKGLDMVYGNVLRIHSKEVHMGKFNFEKLLANNICHQSIFVSKRAFLQCGPYNEAFLACADWSFNIKLFKNKAKVKYVDMIVANYNEEGFSNSYWDTPFFNLLDEERKAYYKKWPNYLLSLGRRAINKAGRVAASALMKKKTA